VEIFVNLQSSEGQEEKSDIEEPSKSEIFSKSEQIIKPEIAIPANKIRTILFVTRS
jgi:hypothetical protein